MSEIKSKNYKKNLMAPPCLEEALRRETILDADNNTNFCSVEILSLPIFLF
jgi:hypothetical protein